MRFVGVVINSVLVLFADSPELDVELERYTAVRQSLAKQGVQDVVQLEVEELDRVIKISPRRLRSCFIAKLLPDPRDGLVDPALTRYLEFNLEREKRQDLFGDVRDIRELRG